MMKCGNFIEVYNNVELLIMLIKCNNLESIKLIKYN